jgi:hypothetical protein
MEENLLAIAYLEGKEKALEQRKTIDMELKPAFKEAKEDKPEAGKLKAAGLEKQIEEAEDGFKKTIERMQEAFIIRYPSLESIRELPPPIVSLTTGKNIDFILMITKHIFR